MKKLESFDFLDDKQWSPQWEEYLHDTLLFVPSKVQEILCITRIPDTNEILIVADNGRFINNKSILTTLHAFASAIATPIMPSFPTASKNSSYSDNIKSLGTVRTSHSSPLKVLNKPSGSIH